MIKYRLAHPRCLILIVCLFILESCTEKICPTYDSQNRAEIRKSYFRYKKAKVGYSILRKKH
jgi:hypothetical protein